MTEQYSDQAPTFMAQDAAAWVKDTVLPPRIRGRAGDAADLLLTRCACQYGPSARCHAGDHDRCGHRLQPSYYDAGFPEAYLLSRRTDGGTSSALAEVWPRRRPCRWRCSCACHEQTSEAAQDRGLLFDLDHGLPV
ncbi:DUF6248 family natural product biosynthesis protein [Streptomyces diastaticus]|uniref:DUF6248 family natural product biosynthesis protein n=1 Tax=Streptomyces diastaticus TaxID=1956 RepID=UPI0033C6E6B6